MLLLDDGRVYGMGRNDRGQLGLGVYGPKRQFGAVQIMALQKTNVRRLYCGASHAFAVTSEGELYAWGRNDSGQLGLGKGGRDVCDPVLVECVAGVCVFVCVFVCVYVCMYVCMYVCTVSMRVLFCI